MIKETSGQVSGERGEPQVHRRTPHHRVRRPGHLPVDRRGHRLVHQEIRDHGPPLPHRPESAPAHTPSPPPTPSPTTYARPSSRSTGKKVRTKLIEVRLYCPNLTITSPKCRAQLRQFAPRYLADAASPSSDGDFCARRAKSGHLVAACLAMSLIRHSSLEG